MAKRKICTLLLVGRRWFARTYGNTYHSVEIYVNGNRVYKVDYAYGYGSQWEWTAFDWLDANGYTPGRQHSANGSRECAWRYCERMGIQYNSTVTDVQRKKDL